MDNARQKEKMTLLSKLLDHFTEASTEATKTANAIICSQKDATSLHYTLEKILDLIIALAEQAYNAYRQSTELKDELERIDAGRLANKINNIRQILMLSEKVASVGYIELADRILVAEDDTFDYALREAASQNPETVKRLAVAIERWQAK
jgi:hypothetical protein